MKVSELQAPPELVAAWERDLEDLTPVQEAAVRAGILEGRENLLVVAPTSSGKTLVGEMAAAQIAMTGQKHVFVAVPMKSLAEEHFFRLQERYRDLMNVVISTGDRLEYDEDIRQGHFDLAVLTYEKLAMLVVQSGSLLSRCGCVVVDEGQMISDEHRGTGLEVLITQILLAPAAPRLVVLSASLDDLNELDAWLRAKPIVQDERPVPLHQAVCSAESARALMVWADGHREEIQMTRPTGGDVDALAAELALESAAAGRQVILFRASIPKVTSTARLIAEHRQASGVRPELNERLLELEDPDAVKEIADLLACGVAFHNADLSAPERRVVEDAFRAGDVRILVSTTTLAMGVNMPADVVIVADTERWELEGANWTTKPLSVADYRNAAGRAGRLNIRAEGTAILLARDDVKRLQALRSYVLGDVEPVESQIPKSPLHDVVLRLLAGQVAKTEAGLVDFVCSTFAYRTYYDRYGGLDAVRKAVAGAVYASVESGLIIRRDDELLPTSVARVLAGAGIGLTTAVILKGLVDRLQASDVAGADIVYEVSLCRESGNRPFAPRRLQTCRWDFSDHPHDPDGLLRKAVKAVVLRDFELQATEQASCLLNWMSGGPTRELHKNFSMTRERLREMGGNAAWLIQTLASAARAAGVPADRVRAVKEMALRAQYGLPHELAQLASMRPPSVSREALMQLREKGIIAPDDLLEADAGSLQPALSARVAQTFKETILRETAMSLRRKRSGHVRAAGEAGVPARLIETLYAATGKPLEEAVRDAFQTAGLAAKRIENQPHGEEDIQLATKRGTVVVSATGSETDEKPIKWTKAQNVMGQGAGLNPVNCVCVGRPRFEALAERNANDIAREEGDRRILLVAVDVLVEAMLRCVRGQIAAADFGEVLATSRGILRVEDLPTPEPAPGLSLTDA
jgi:ATP-dependent DNA helicase